MRVMARYHGVNPPEMQGEFILVDESIFHEYAYCRYQDGAWEYDLNRLFRMSEVEDLRPWPQRLKSRVRRWLLRKLL